MQTGFLFSSCSCYTSGKCPLSIIAGIGEIINLFLFDVIRQKEEKVAEIIHKSKIIFLLNFFKKFD